MNSINKKNTILKRKYSSFIRLFRGYLSIYNITKRLTCNLRGAPATGSPPRTSKQPPRPARRLPAPRPPGQRRRRRQLVGRRGRGGRGAQVEHDRLSPEAPTPAPGGAGGGGGGGGLASPRGLVGLADAADDGVDGLAHHDCGGGGCRGGCRWRLRRGRGRCCHLQQSCVGILHSYLCM